MKKLQTILTLLCVPVLGLYAQKPMTLKNCMEFALNNSAQILTTKEFTYQKQINRRDAVLGVFTPQINAYAGLALTNGRTTDPETNMYTDLKMFQDESVDTVLYDPPYSPRQVSECYRALGMSVNMATTQASYWAAQKKEIARICRPQGIVITCSWNSGGIGMKLGFEMLEVLLVPHGGWHNDTIAVVERKSPSLLEFC